MQPRCRGGLFPPTAPLYQPVLDACLHTCSPVSGERSRTSLSHFSRRCRARSAAPRRDLLPGPEMLLTDRQVTLISTFSHIDWLPSPPPRPPPPAHLPPSGALSALGFTPAGDCKSSRQGFLMTAALCVARARLDEGRAGQAVPVVTGAC